MCKGLLPLWQGPCLAPGAAVNLAEPPTGGRAGSDSVHVAEEHHSEILFYAELA